MTEITSQVIEKIKAKEEVTFHEYKDALEFAYNALGSDDVKEYNFGLTIICHVSTAKPKDLLIQQLLYDCIICSRIFLYSYMLNDYLVDCYTDQFEDIKKFIYTNHKTKTILTKDQKKLLKIFDIHRKLVISAPTSFGKSRIIPEIISAYDYKNIAIVLPTIALLNETYASLKQYKFLTEKYQIVNSLMMSLNDKNILIFTPEKMDIFLDENPNINIDFFVMDEIYKIQDDPERKQIFTHCLYRLTQMKTDFYLIGPYFNKFSEQFLEKTNSVFEKFSTEIVKKDIVDISVIPDNSIYNLFGHELKKYVGKDVNLKHILNSFDEPSLIYAKQIRAVESLAKNHAGQRKIEDSSNGLIEYIEESVSPDWSLVKCLKKRVAFHHGKIPRYIQIEIVDLFNRREIDYLFCTSTLIEGVNTSAKNVVIYDNLKGNNDKLTGFDIKNIQGRAGRFLQHFIGNIVILEPTEEASERDYIEFSYYDHKNLTDDEILQVSNDDLNSELQKRYKEIKEMLQNNNIPLDIIKKNKFIDIWSQIRLINHLRKNINLQKEIYFEKNFPEKDQLDKILDILHEYLFNEQDKNDKGIPIWTLKHFTKYYVYKSPTIKDIVSQQKSKNPDTRIRSAFKLISHYFEFALPKYLTIFENLYNFSSTKSISLKGTSKNYFHSSLNLPN